MSLHDFLAGSLELLALLESIDRRQQRISADLARLAGLSVGEAKRRVLFIHLRADQRAAEAELKRAADLLSLFGSCQFVLD